MLMIKSELNACGHDDGHEKDTDLAPALPDSMRTDRCLSCQSQDQSSHHMASCSLCRYDKGSIRTWPPLPAPTLAGAGRADAQNILSHTNMSTPVSDVLHHPKQYLCQQTYRLASLPDAAACCKPASCCWLRTAMPRPGCAKDAPCMHSASQPAQHSGVSG